LNSSSASLEALPQLARVIPRDGHPISRSRISPDALRVLYRLKDAGYQAFLVGGCVRDLMIGLTPKDFDVATNALPEEVRRLFRNCRLVGRRFRLAHVFFGRETIEVATFRAASAPELGDEPLPDVDTELDADADVDADVDADSEVEGDVDGNVALEDDGEDAEAIDAIAVAPEPAAPERAQRRGADDDTERVVDQHGRILRDNVYGSIDDDVWRRDFTANALYYNIADFSVWDYVGGFEDVQARRLRLIGDPETRYREDPVRMLRAARFEAKLGFTLDSATAEPIESLRHLLAGVPSARLFDETLKLFLGGHGARSFEVLRRRRLIDVLLPNVGEFLRRYPGTPIERLLLRGLENTDARVQQDRPVSPTFLFSILLYGPIAVEIESAPRERWHDVGTILDAVETAVRGVQARVALPRRFALGLRDMYALQPRLEAPRGRRSLRLLENPRFRAAFDLLVLRAEFGMASREIVDYWIRLQESSPEQRGVLADAQASNAGPGPRTGGGAPRPAGQGRGRRPRRRGGR
jgi:poly(A) polymerase